jgi:hypothetical protein
MRLILQSLLRALFFHVEIGAAEKTVETGQYEFKSPLLGPNEVVALAKNYLIQKTKNDLRKYELSGLSFHFYSKWGREKDKRKGEWFVTFSIIGPAPPDSDLGVTISNEKRPEVKLVSGP